MKNTKTRKKAPKRLATPAYKRRWDSLPGEEQEARIRALEVLRLVRVGESLYSSSATLGVSPRAVRRQLGPSFYKRGHRWRATTRDRIERGLKIYEKGRITVIVVGDSGAASIIGQYFNDVKKALISNDASYLRKYKKITIRDAKGKLHKLETRLAKLFEIEEGREDIEFSDIYD